MARRLLEDFIVGAVEAQAVSWGDLEDLRVMHADPMVMATLGGVRDRQQTEHYLKRNLAHWQSHGFGIFCLRERETRRLIGRAGLRWVRLDRADEIEVAYALRAEAWGRGLATAICRQLAVMGGDAGLANELVAFTLTSNRRSRRVMEKSGFDYEREFEYAGSPHVLYRRRLIRAVDDITS